MPQASSHPAQRTDVPERHMAGLGSAAPSADAPGLPSLSDTDTDTDTDTGTDTDIDTLAPADIRGLSKSLFARLGEVEEGTHEYAYARNTLIELNLNLVHYAARRLRAHGDSYEDVVQVGTIGLIKAIDRFDLQRGVEFTSFALPTVMGEIKRFFRDTTWAVHVPRRLKELSLHLDRAKTLLEQVDGHAPTVAELAAHLGLDECEVAEGLKATNGCTAASLDRSVDAGEPDDTLAAHIGCHDPELAKAENLQALKPLIAALESRDRELLALRFVDELTQAEIGRELGVSQMQVSRRLTRVLDRLRVKLSV
ncbi:SigB/SigF/SigG family RNA polymerase sigma factor [Streptomyces sp. NBC_01016]|uniref:SigB/SigF/SigG family RNA polymerase sigma factor n=1 Tax=Streptomyces sp. NBC_01016 TaxID=2903720 RepID=UPI002251F176|nr:SigB/SigF/SigG family RNA polymerase sigma factor [Streptomyces sp. NBC_01016]MCX4834639.1 SigB/SigF/SigG family RNA polymerase sigma factor [Streptomyces sp. NBC_01016]